MLRHRRCGVDHFETTGGSGIYEYYISNNPTVVTTQTEWTGLAGGQTVSIYAVDSNGCLGQSNPVVIFTPTEISVEFSPTVAVVDATCANTLMAKSFWCFWRCRTRDHSILSGW